LLKWWKLIWRTSDVSCVVKDQKTIMYTKARFFIIWLIYLSLNLTLLDDNLIIVFFCN